jgi:DNA-binding PadR family transcriptional regulator
MQAALLKLLPLSEATCYILLALRQPAHGYAVMQQVEAMSEGTVRLGPGTLYGAFAKLEKDGLITLLSEEDRRKSYTLTRQGRALLDEQMRRLGIMLRNGQAA